MVLSDASWDRAGLALSCYLFYLFTRPWALWVFLLNLREHFGPFESHASSRSTDSAQRQNCQRAGGESIISGNPTIKFDLFN